MLAGQSAGLLLLDPLDHHLKAHNLGDPLVRGLEPARADGFVALGLGVLQQGVEILDAFELRHFDFSSRFFLYLL